MLGPQSQNRFRLKQEKDRQPMLPNVMHFEREHSQLKKGVTLIRYETVACTYFEKRDMQLFQLYALEMGQGAPALLLQAASHKSSCQAIK